VLQPLNGIFTLTEYPDLLVGLDAPDDAAVYRVAPFDGDVARKLVEAELGRGLAEAYESFDTTPLASASLAQVHAGTLHGRRRGCLRGWWGRFRASVVRLAQPGQLFEDLGITYIGAVPGHDLHALLETLSSALALPGPAIVHVRTQKGRGFRPAEADQVSFHGAALPPMSLTPTLAADGGATAAVVIGSSAAIAPHDLAPASPMPTESMTDDAAAPAIEATAKVKHPNYTAVFADERIVGTAAEVWDDLVRGAPLTEAHRVAGARFSAGVATSTDVLDAQLTILQASLERTQAAVSLRIAEADLARAVGRQGP